MAKQNVLIMFGGLSAEHEVSIITGLQVLEKIDREKYEPHVVYVNKQGLFKYLPGMQSRKDFNAEKGINCVLGQDENGAFLRTFGILGKVLKVDAAYLAFHGGNGEGGQIQGLLEMYNIPFTSPNYEASVIAMNKVLTNQVLKDHGITTVPGLSFTSKDCKLNNETVVKTIVQQLNLPVIIKPAHLGSSIGINIAKNEAELGKYLLEASFVDSEILVEKLIQNFVEFNCSVRTVKDEIVASEVEKPVGKDEFLSFADKYKRGGGKKTGGAGMASLARELPAKIDDSLRNQIRQTAIQIYKACRCKGFVRIDFMYNDEGMYVTEINPIPGSVAYYLWEASGVPFTQQITESIEQAILDNEVRLSHKLDYESDIVEKFVAG